MMNIAPKPEALVSNLMPVSTDPRRPVESEVVLASS